MTARLQSVAAERWISFENVLILIWNEIHPWWNKNEFWFTHHLLYHLKTVLHSTLLKALVQKLFHRIFILLQGGYRQHVMCVHGNRIDCMVFLLYCNTFTVYSTEFFLSTSFLDKGALSAVFDGDTKASIAYFLFEKNRKRASGKRFCLSRCPNTLVSNR